VNSITRLEEHQLRTRLENPILRGLPSFLSSYLDAVSEHLEDCDGRRLQIEDFEPAAIAYASADCTRFLLANAEDIGLMFPQAGYDFGSVRSGEVANAFCRWGSTSEATRMRLMVAAFSFGSHGFEVVNDRITYTGGL